MLDQDPSPTFMAPIGALSAIDMTVLLAFIRAGTRLFRIRSCSALVPDCRDSKMPFWRICNKLIVK